MSNTPNEVNAEEVATILRQRLADETWRAVLLETKCNELATQLAASANDKMRIRELELRLEQANPDTQGE